MAGTIRKVGDSYQLRVSNGYDKNGKRKDYYKTIKAKSMREAEKELALFYADVISGDVSKGTSLSLGKAFDYWIEHYVRQNLKPSTVYSDEQIAKAIVEYFGNRKASAIYPYEVQQFIDFELKTHSAKTVLNHFAVLNQMYKYMCKLEVLDNNPCANVFLPKKEHTEARFLKIDEIKILVDGLNALPESDLNFKCAILLMLFGGLRRGEVLGLEWNCVDFENCQIEIKKTRLNSAGTGMYDSTPKTKTSQRYVALPEPLFYDLARLKEFNDKLCLYMNKECKNVILGVQGSPLSSDVLHSNWKRFINSLGIEYINLHGLRHTHTSMLLDLGTEMFDISRHLGHSTTQTTMSVYAHLINSKDKIIANKLEKYL